jgi:aldose 1-epimerase
MAGITKEPFGSLPDGSKADLYTLTNAKGARMKITNYGGLITMLEAPDRAGKLADVALGYDNLAAYLKSSPYFGAMIGRCGNRLGNAAFTLDGKTYNLAKNDGPNHLHGGVRGFDKVLWQAEPGQAPEGPWLMLRYRSPDMEEGYPGNLDVSILVTWTANAVTFEFKASTDKPTIVNLTQHSYFNLAGAGTGDILGHEVMIPADAFTPADDGFITTGEIRPVKGTPFDFNTPIAIGQRINDADEQLKKGPCGYDQNFVLRKKEGQMSLAARVREPKSGRVLEVETTEPGIQFYSGNFLDGTNIGKGGAVYKYRNGFCLEPQHFPDAPNKPNFPSIVLRPGQAYRHAMAYRFLAD